MARALEIIRRVDEHDGHRQQRHHFQDLRHAVELEQAAERGDRCPRRLDRGQTAVTSKAATARTPVQMRAAHRSASDREQDRAGGKPQENLRPGIVETGVEIGDVEGSHGSLFRTKS